MPRRTKEEAEETRQLLIKTALKVFSEQGIQKTTLAVVASEAGVTRGAIYWHFKDKADLLEALWAKVVGPMELKYQALKGQAASDPISLLEQVAISFFNLAATDTEFQQVLRITMQSRTDPVLVERYHRLCEDEMLQLRDVMKQVKAAGQLRENLSIDAASHIYYGYLEGVTNNWLISDDSRLLKENADVLAKVLIQGLKK